MMGVSQNKKYNKRWFIENALLYLLHYCKIYTYTVI